MSAPLEWAPSSNERPLNEANNLMSAPLEWAPSFKFVFLNERPGRSFEEIRYAADYL